MRYLLGFALLLVLPACHVGRFFIYNFADLQDNRKFAARPVARGAGPAFRFAEASAGAPRLRLPGGRGLAAFEAELKSSGTVAFLIIRRDTLLYERYFAGYEAGSEVPSFSVAKSVVSALVGVAIGEGYIKSVDEPITAYLPELRRPDFDRVTIRHLLQMRSGLDFNEGYFNPFGQVAKFYYGTDLPRFVRQLRVARPPDDAFEYRSGNTQLLGMLVARATRRPLAQYLQEKLWQPLGMEYDASWSLDSRRSGTEKAFCCLNARARDFAKLGRLYLRRGEWQGQQLVPRAWVETSVYDPATAAPNEFLYGYQWWHTRRLRPAPDSARGPHLWRGRDGRQGRLSPSGDFFAQGILGQFVYVYPAKDLIMVRLGKRYGRPWAELGRQLAELN